MKACPERGKMVFSVTFMQSPQFTRATAKLLNKDRRRLGWSKEQHHIHTGNIDTFIQDIYREQDLKIMSIILQIIISSDTLTDIITSSQISGMIPLS